MARRPARKRKQTRKEVARILLLTAGIYAVMLVVVYGGGGPTNCTPGREIQEGCTMAFPIVLAFFFPALVCGSVLFVTLVHRKETKNRRKKR